MWEFLNRNIKEYNYLFLYAHKVDSHILTFEETVLYFLMDIYSMYLPLAH